MKGERERDLVRVGRSVYVAESNANQAEREREVVREKNTHAQTESVIEREKRSKESKEGSTQ